MELSSISITIAWSCINYTVSTLSSYKHCRITLKILFRLPGFFSMKWEGEMSNAKYDEADIDRLVAFLK